MSDIHKLLLKYKLPKENLKKLAELFARHPSLAKYKIKTYDPQKLTPEQLQKYIASLLANRTVGDKAKVKKLLLDLHTRDKAKNIQGISKLKKNKMDNKLSAEYLKNNKFMTQADIEKQNKRYAEMATDKDLTTKDLLKKQLAQQEQLNLMQLYPLLSQIEQDELKKKTTPAITPKKTTSKSKKGVSVEEYDYKAFDNTAKLRALLTKDASTEMEEAYNYDYGYYADGKQAKANDFLKFWIENYNIKAYGGKSESQLKADTTASEIPFADVFNDFTKDLQDEKPLSKSQKKKLKKQEAKQQAMDVLIPPEERLLADNEDALRKYYNNISGNPKKSSLIKNPVEFEAIARLCVDDNIKITYTKRDGLKFIAQDNDETLSLKEFLSVYHNELSAIHSSVAQDIRQSFDAIHEKQLAQPKGPPPPQIDEDPTVNITLESENLTKSTTRQEKEDILKQYWKKYPDNNIFQQYGIFLNNVANFCVQHGIDIDASKTRKGLYLNFIDGNKNYNALEFVIRFGDEIKQDYGDEVAPVEAVPAEVAPVEAVPAEVAPQEAEENDINNYLIPSRSKFKQYYGEDQIREIINKFNTKYPVNILNTSKYSDNAIIKYIAMNNMDIRALEKDGNLYLNMTTIDDRYTLQEFIDAMHEHFETSAPYTRKEELPELRAQGFKPMHPLLAGALISHHWVMKHGNLKPEHQKLVNKHVLDIAKKTHGGFIFRAIHNLVQGKPLLAQEPPTLPDLISRNGIRRLLDESNIDDNAKNFIRNALNTKKLDGTGGGFLDDMMDKAGNAFLKYNPLSLLLKSLYNAGRKDLGYTN